MDRPKRPAPPVAAPPIAAPPSSIAEQDENRHERERIAAIAQAFMARNHDLLVRLAK